MKHFNVRNIFIFQRVLVLIMIAIFWGLFGCPLIAVVLILLISIPSIVRYKIVNSWWLFVGEFVIAAVFAFFWTPSLIGLWLIVLGVAENLISAEMKRLSDEVNNSREVIIAMENIYTNTQNVIEQATANAEITERGRIAQDLHDHVGHEIAGISLGLQATQKMLQKGEVAHAEEMLTNVITRTNDAAIHLRETVHNLKPVAADDCSVIENICRNFSHCPVHFSASGNLSDINQGQLELLSALLKEALTNVVRHSSATMVEVKINANSHHLRMMVADNGEIGEDFVIGMGLSGMRERITAMDGVFTIDTSDGFRIICVLPKKCESGVKNENTNR